MRVFSNFKALYGLYNRVRTEESLRTQMQLNTTRHAKVFEPGDVAFRRLPSGARLPKHLFPEPSSGPYVVKGMHSHSSVLLLTPDGAPVDKGA